jgi:hypothetical protein
MERKDDRSDDYSVIVSGLKKNPYIECDGRGRNGDVGKDEESLERVTVEKVLETGSLNLPAGGSCGSEVIGGSSPHQAPWRLPFLNLVTHTAAASQKHMSK